MKNRQTLMLLGQSNFTNSVSLHHTSKKSLHNKLQPTLWITVLEKRLIA